MPGFNPEPSSIQISRMLRRQPPIGGIAFKSGVTQHPFPLKRADGGGIPDSPLSPVIGAINTDTPGRADAHPTHVPPGSYVMPADIVSMMGEGNTAAGVKFLAKMFLPLSAQSGKQTTLMGQGAPYGATGAPYGAQMPDLRARAMPPPHYPAPYVPPQPKLPSFGTQAAGGAVPVEEGKPGTPINISGGEFVVPPAEVKRRGMGDIDLGHEILDKWVKDLRAEHIKTLKRLPGPAK
jgi:hypothetical protein